MDPPRVLQSFVAEHNTLCELVYVFLRDRRYDAGAFATAADLARSVHSLLRRSDQRYLVFPTADLEAFQESCRAMLRQLNRRAREIQAYPCLPSPALGPHTPPSSPILRASSPVDSDDSDDDQQTAVSVKLMAYAIFDTMTGNILGICMSPEAEGAAQAVLRLRSSFRAGVKLVSLCSVAGDVAAEGARF
ncbi:hypothetical protein AURDEDRAFT_176055 [Auricularia subglabra TFB-10046 SS5]|uniref:Uncharacterized protein n=1 Tax=Auricularia subglabra (strain TFB-10046 / SS5) TaxID=717982 RepID=J0LDT9_AURST|nr:hypothetical protein AURDEDRAFT_176055 [Auricularia subglabra TFB-10046 SS5]